MLKMPKKIDLENMLRQSQRLAERDGFVQGLSKMFNVKPREIVDVLRNSEKDEDVFKRYKLAELAGILKKDYNMNNYVKNAELIKKYGRKNVIVMAKEATEKRQSTYKVDDVATRLGLTDIDDINQIVPFCYEASDLMNMIGEYTTLLKTHDKKGDLHIYLHDKSDAELSARLQNTKSKNGVDKILAEAGIDQKIYFKIFHVLKGRLTPTDSDLPVEYDPGSIPYNTTLENLFDGAYRDEPMEKFTGGVQIQEAYPRKELNLGLD